MDDMEKRFILSRAVEKYGGHAQTLIAIEEMSELTKALIKFWRYPATTTRLDVLEEMADVQIMLNQLNLIYLDPGETLDSMMDAKLLKLEKMMKKKN